MSVNGSASNFHFNVTDPGTGKSGIIVKSNLNNSSGNWNIDGILYVSGSATFTNSQNIVIDGAIVTGGAVNINTGLPLDLTFNSARAIAVLGVTSVPTAVQVLHWEEEY
jgi:hypothetical protein